MAYNGPLPQVVKAGGTGVSSVTTTPAATAFAGWDANKNFTVNDLIIGFNQNTLIGGSNTMTVASAQYQHIGGSGGTIVLPDATTLAISQQYYFDNDASGNVTIETNGGATLFVASPGVFYVVLLASNGSSAGSWYYYASLPSLNLTQYDVLVGGAGQTITSVGPGTSGQVLQSGGSSANPAYSTATYPATTTINQLLYSSAANTIGGITAANNGVLISGTTGIPSWLANSGTAGYVLTANSGAPPSWQAGGGGSGITTIDGDSGSATGSTIAFTATSNCGSSVSFAASGSIVAFNVSDTNSNTLIGSGAGNSTISGIANCGYGVNSLLSLTSGNYNSIYGDAAAFNLQGGVNNTAAGYSALTNLVSGGSNIAIGIFAADNYTGAESSNIIIGNEGVLGESNIIRIGTQGSSAGEQNKCFIAGIDGVVITGSAVLCSSSGQLGDVVSALRFKEDIQDLPETDNFLKLRPVSFKYKSEKEKNLHYGFVAEEVEKVFPSLVLYDKEKQPYSVAYHEMAPLLLLEIQKLQKEIEGLKKRLI